jgi:hypothetical protein
MKRGVIMDNINSEQENNKIFAETNTLYDFYELEEKWEAARHADSHPFLRYIHKVTDENHINKKSNKHK